MTMMVVTVMKLLMMVVAVKLAVTVHMILHLTALNAVIQQQLSMV